MKKKILTGATIVSLALTLIGCGTDYDFVTLPDYIGIPIPVISEITITEADITARVDSNLKATVIYADVTDRAIQKGDIVNVDVMGTVDDGVAYSNNTVVGYDMKIGSEFFIEGFDQAMIGRSIGADFNINLTFPDDYHTNKDVAGKDVSFHVVVNSIKEQLDPILSDEIVQKLSSTASNVTEYRLEIQKQLEVEASSTYKNSSYEIVWDYVMTNTTVDDYPSDLLNDELTVIEDGYIRSADLAGVSLEIYVTTRLNLDAETFKEQNLNMAQYNLKTNAIINTIAEEEKLTPTNDEYIDYYQEYVMKLGCSDVTELLLMRDEASLRTEILTTIVKDFLVTNAVQTNK